MACRRGHRRPSGRGGRPQRGPDGQGDVAAFDIIPPVYDDIAAGATKASPTDFTSLQGRLAVDMVLRLLEGQKLPANRAGPKPAMVTSETIKAFNMTDMFAPAGYKVEFSVDAK